jgi:hypothetical protein
MSLIAYQKRLGKKMIDCGDFHSLLKRVDSVCNLSLDNLNILHEQFQESKLCFVHNGDSHHAKLCWIYQTIIRVHVHYRIAFDLLKEKKFYNAWCEIEKTENHLCWLEKHYDFSEGQFFLSHIKKTVNILQSIFPYKIFGSCEMKFKRTCSICGQLKTPRSQCNHEIGEIYDGEMCGVNVTSINILGYSFVEKPAFKYSVPFINVDPETGETIDQYDYTLVENISSKLCSPYQNWDLRISQKTRHITAEEYVSIGRNGKCPCSSGKKFKRCCMDKGCISYPHYDLFIPRSHDVNDSSMDTIK